MKHTTRILAALTLLLGGVRQAKADLFVYTGQAVFATATTGLVDTNFNGIVPAGGFAAYPTPPGFTSPATGVNFNIANAVAGGRDALNLTSASYYAPTSYPQDFLIHNSGAFNSTIQEVITLPAPVRAVGLERGTFNGAPLTFTFSNGSSYVDPTPPGFGTTSFLGFVTTTPISSLTITYPSSDSLVISDFQSAANAPEPSSLVLLCLGAGCLAGYRWRRRAGVA